MPCAIRRCASVAVRVAWRDFHASQPPVTTLPFNSIKSFSAIGIPCSGPTEWPARIAASAARAARRASWAYTSTNACRLGSCAVMRAR
jgi:hypothetical protein